MKQEPENLTLAHDEQPASRADKGVGPREFVRIRSLTFVCVAQAGMALLMGAIGTVDSDTIIPACYFSFSTLFGAWLMRDKPNIQDYTRHE